MSEKLHIEEFKNFMADSRTPMTYTLDFCFQDDIEQENLFHPELLDYYRALAKHIGIKTEENSHTYDTDKGVENDA